VRIALGSSCKSAASTVSSAALLMCPWIVLTGRGSACPRHRDTGHQRSPKDSEPRRCVLDLETSVGLNSPVGACPPPVCTPGRLRLLSEPRIPLIGQKIKINLTALPDQVAWLWFLFEPSGLARARSSPDLDKQGPATKTPMKTASKNMCQLSSSAHSGAQKRLYTTSCLGRRLLWRGAFT